jgi:hypothetical protein
MGSRNIGMFLEPGPETLNKNNLVAPRGIAWWWATASPSRSAAPPFGLSTVLRAGGAALDLLGLTGGGQPVRAALLTVVEEVRDHHAAPDNRGADTDGLGGGGSGARAARRCIPTKWPCPSVERGSAEGLLRRHCRRRDVSLISDLLSLQQCLQDLARIKLQTAGARRRIGKLPPGIGRESALYLARLAGRLRWLRGPATTCRQTGG